MVHEISSRLALCGTLYLYLYTQFYYTTKCRYLIDYFKKDYIKCFSEFRKYQKLFKLMANSQNYCIKNIVAQTNCSIPDPIISYILHKDNKILLHKPDEYVYKICSVCKYFFSKLRLIPCSQLSVEYDCLKFSYTPTIIPRPTAKILFQDLKKAKNFFSPVVLCMDTTKLDLSQSKIISNIITKMYSYNILKIILRNQELTLPELIFLTPNNKDLIFFNCKVVQNNGLTVSVEEILTVSPKIRQLAL
jgi:hypothetical protein